MISHSEYIIRNYSAGDFDSFVELKIKAATFFPDVDYISKLLIREIIARPNYTPEKDLFVAEMDGKIVGYADVIPEKSINRVIWDGYVHPAHRRKGLGSELFKSVETRAREIGIDATHINVDKNNTLARSLLEKLGFKVIRDSYELKYDLTQFIPSDIPTTVSIRHLEKGEEDELLTIQNRSFIGTWGFSPNTIDEITYTSGMSNSPYTGILLARDGDKPIGYCWTKIETINESADIDGIARISMLGVDPDYRGKGLGRELLLTGLAYLKENDFHFARLTVDQQNEAAYSLYRSIGFTVCNTSLWYEKSSN